MNIYLPLFVHVCKFTTICVVSTFRNYSDQSKFKPTTFVWTFPKLGTWCSLLVDVVHKFFSLLLFYISLWYSSILPVYEGTPTHVEISKTSGRTYTVRSKKNADSVLEKYITNLSNMLSIRNSSISIL